MKLTRIKVFDYLFSGVNSTFTPEEDGLIYPFMCKAQKTYQHPTNKPMSEWNITDKHRFAKYVHELIPEELILKTPPLKPDYVVISKLQIRGYLFENKRYRKRTEYLINEAKTKIGDFVPRSGRPQSQWGVHDILEYVTEIYNHIKING